MICCRSRAAFRFTAPGESAIINRYAPRDVTHTLPVDTLAEVPQSALSGVARVLVHAGKLNAKVAEDFNEERRRTANREIFEKLRERYQVTVDESALTNAPVPGVKIAQR